MKDEVRVCLAAGEGVRRYKTLTGSDAQVSLDPGTPPSPLHPPHHATTRGATPGVEMRNILLGHASVEYKCLR